MIFVKEYFKYHCWYCDTPDCNSDHEGCKNFLKYLQDNHFKVTDYYGDHPNYDRTRLVGSESTPKETKSDELFFCAIYIYFYLNDHNIDNIKHYISFIRKKNWRKQ